MPKLTIPDEETIATFTVTTANDTFPFDFAVFTKADLRVRVGADTELDQADFLLNGTLLEGGGYQGGTVILNTPISATTLRIWRSCTPQRSENFGAVTAVAIAAVDLALSRQMAVSQDLKRDQAVIEDVLPYLTDLPATIEEVLVARDEAVAATASKADQTDLLALGDVVDGQALLVTDASDDAAQALLDADEALDATLLKVDLDAGNVPDPLVFRTAITASTASAEPEASGAAGTGTGNDAAAIALAVLEAIANRKPVDLSGAYRVTADIVVTNESAEFCGRSMGLSKVILANDAQIIFDGGDPDDYAGNSFRLKNMIIRTEGARTKPLIECSFNANGAGRNAVNAQFENLDIGGVTEDDHFPAAIALFNCQNLSIKGCRIDGGIGGFTEATYTDGGQLTNLTPATWLSDAAITLGGDDEPTEFKISDTFIYNVNDAVTIDGALEGIYFTNVTIVSTQRGVVDRAGGDPLVAFVGCHINTRQKGIEATNRFQSTMTGCLIYGFGNETYVGLDLKQGTGPTLAWTVTGNNFLGFGNEENKTAVAIDGNLGPAFTATATGTLTWSVAQFAAVTAGQTIATIGATNLLAPSSGTLYRTVANGSVTSGQALGHVALTGGDKYSIFDHNVIENFAVGYRLGVFSSYVTIGPCNAFVGVTTRVVDSGGANRIHYPLLRQPGTQSTIMFGTGAEDATNGLFGINLVPDLDATHLNGTALLKWREVRAVDIIASSGLAGATLGLSGSATIGGNLAVTGSIGGQAITGTSLNVGSGAVTAGAVGCSSVTASGTVQGALVLGQTGSTSSSDVVMAANGGGGGNLQVRADGSNPIYLRVDGLLRQVNKVNMSGYDVLVLV